MKHSIILSIILSVVALSSCDKSAYELETFQQEETLPVLTKASTSTDRTVVVTHLVPVTTETCKSTFSYNETTGVFSERLVLADGLTYLITTKITGWTAVEGTDYFVAEFNNPNVRITNKTCASFCERVTVLSSTIYKLNDVIGYEFTGSYGENNIHIKMDI